MIEAVDKITGANAGGVYRLQIRALRGARIGSVESLGERRRMTLYLIRHAQCLPNKAQRFSDWALSRVGAQQAEQLASLLEPLEITNVFSRPFIRTIETAKPFAQRRGLEIRVVDDLRERLLTNEAGLPSDEVWRRSWEDFSFYLPGCESSVAAQARISRAIGGIAESVESSSAIFTRAGLILDPLGKAKSVVLTEEGEERSRELFQKYFARNA